MLLSMFTTTAQRAVIGALGVATLALGLLAIQQRFEILHLRLDLQTEISERAQETSDRALVASNYQTQLATIQGKHTAQQKELTDAFNRQVDQVKNESATRIASAERVRSDSETRAAGYRRLAEAGTAQCQYLGDRSAALDRDLAAGRVVVERLVADLKRRDSEVMALKGVVLNDRSAVNSAQPVQPVQ